MIILETGEGLPISNSYASVATFIDYCSVRKITAADASTDDIAAALIRSTDYIDSGYVFRSVRSNTAQALQNPRFGEETLNNQVVTATIELAILALTQDIFAVPARGILSKEVHAGKASSTTTYDPAQTVSDRFPAITRILRSIASRVGASIRVGMMTR